VLDSYSMQKLNAELNGVCFYCGDDSHLSTECGESEYVVDGDGALMNVSYLSESEKDLI